MTALLQFLLAIMLSFVLTWLLAVRLRKGDSDRREPLRLSLLLALPVILPAMVLLTGSGFAPPVFVLIAGLLSSLLVCALCVPLASRRLRISALSSLLLLPAALSGHLALGWPLNLLPDLALGLSQQLALQRQIRIEETKAQELLQEYGFALPTDFSVIEARLYPDPQNGSFAFPQHVLRLRSKASDAVQIDVLSEALFKAGYRETGWIDPKQPNPVLYIKEPYAIQFSPSRRSGNTVYSELQLSRDESEAFLAQWVEGWRQGGD